MNSTGEILYNLRGLLPGEEVQVYSKSEDLFRNEKIEIYTIMKEQEKLYIKFERKTSIDGTQGYFSKEEIANIGVSNYSEEKYKEMNLSEYEKECLKETSFEQYIIRRGFDLEGQFNNGLHFRYKNIMMVTSVIREEKYSV